MGNRYLVSRTAEGMKAYLALPDDGDAGNLIFLPDKSKAVPLWKAVAEMWALDVGGEIVPYEPT